MSPAKVRLAWLLVMLGFVGFWALACLGPEFMRNFWQAVMAWLEVPRYF